VESIAREAGISASGLQQLLRRAEGKSVFEYVRDQRLQRAREALKAGDISVQEASHLAGYSNPANFATAFRKRFGVVPSQV
jgi:AraC-like DNA-binding protein